MFPCRRACARELRGFPRASGDVPGICSARHTSLVFSPRERGCSGVTESSRMWVSVFPARAGMFPEVDRVPRQPGRFPRASGDVPSRRFFNAVCPSFSPRERGCSPCRSWYPAESCVFPARAGMFLGIVCHRPFCSSFPRASGDVTAQKTPLPSSRTFSPRERGCSLILNLSSITDSVFPARAGMFPKANPQARTCICFPRASGDVPSGLIVLMRGIRFSPRERGCSPDGRRWRERDEVFPARAGMFLRARVTWLRRWGFPRASGDVPHLTAHDMTATEFSPRERGCSSTRRLTPSTRMVFPARAGMFRCAFGNPTGAASFPRASGDVPIADTPVGFTDKFSPRERGCSRIHIWCRLHPVVFPARAGMFLRRNRASAKKAGFPRASGDVPSCCLHLIEDTPFSPRERGCSHERQSDVRPGRVFPARAGMFPHAFGNCTPAGGFPRASGDVPAIRNVLHNQPIVFPARAGMFP